MEHHWKHEYEDYIKHEVAVLKRWMRIYRKNPEDVLLIAYRYADRHPEDECVSQ